MSAASEGGRERVVVRWDRADRVDEDDAHWSIAVASVGREPGPEIFEDARDRGSAEAKRVR